MNEQQRSSSLILGAALVIAAFVFGMFFYMSRAQDRTIRTTGLATQSLESDVIKWRITLTRTAAASAMRTGYTQVKEDLQSLLHQLEQAGVKQEDISIQPVNPQAVYSGTGVISNYQIQQPLFIASSNVGAVETVALNPASIVERGGILQFSSIEYFSTRLPELKRALLGEATEDAKRRAEGIAQVSGLKVGRLMSARAGVFQITEPYSAEVGGMGMYNTSTKKKDVSVTVNAVYEVQ